MNITFNIYDDIEHREHRVFIRIGLNQNRDFFINDFTVYELLKYPGWVLTGQGEIGIMVSSIEELPESPALETVAYIKTTGEFYKYVNDGIVRLRRNINTETSFTLLDVLEYTIEIPDGKGRKTFNFFDDLSRYRGTDNIIEFYLERIKQELIENIKERNNLKENIEEIEAELITLGALDWQPDPLDPLNSADDEIRILHEDLAGSKSLLSSLEEEVGGWDYIPNTEPITEPIAMKWTIEDHGFKTNNSNNDGEIVELEKEGRLSLFFRNFVDFLNEYSLTDYIPVDNEGSLYKQLQKKLKDKEKILVQF